MRPVVRSANFTAAIDNFASATLKRSPGERDVLFLIDRRGEPLVLVSWNAWQWLARHSGEMSRPAALYPRYLHRIVEYRDNAAAPMNAGHEQLWLRAGLNQRPFYFCPSAVAHRAETSNAAPPQRGALRTRLLRSGRRTGARIIGCRLHDYSLHCEWCDATWRSLSSRPHRPSLQ